MVLALPGVVAALSGAKKVSLLPTFLLLIIVSNVGFFDLVIQTVITDYPDQVLLDNISVNVEHNVPSPLRETVHVLVRFSSIRFSDQTLSLRFILIFGYRAIRGGPRLGLC